MNVSPNVRGNLSALLCLRILLRYVNAEPDPKERAERLKILRADGWIE